MCLSGLLHAPSSTDGANGIFACEVFLDGPLTTGQMTVLTKVEEAR